MDGPADENLLEVPGHPVIFHALFPFDEDSLAASIRANKLLFGKLDLNDSLDQVFRETRLLAAVGFLGLLRRSLLGIGGFFFLRSFDPLQEQLELVRMNLFAAGSEVFAQDLLELPLQLPTQRALLL